MRKNGLIALRPLGVRAEGLVRLVGGAAQFSVRGVSCARGALALENGRVLVVPLSPTPGGCRGALAFEGNVAGAGVFRAGEVLLAGGVRGNVPETIVARVRQAALCDAAAQRVQDENADEPEQPENPENPGKNLPASRRCDQSGAELPPAGEMQPPAPGELADVIGQRPKAEDVLREMPHPVPPAQSAPQKTAEQQALGALAGRMMERARKEEEARPSLSQDEREEAAAPVRLWEGLPKETAQEDDGAQTRIYVAAQKAPKAQEEALEAEREPEERPAPNSAGGGAEESDFQTEAGGQSGAGEEPKNEARAPTPSGLPQEETEPQKERAAPLEQTDPMEGAKGLGEAPEQKTGTEAAQSQTGAPGASALWPDASPSESAEEGVSAPLGPERSIAPAKEQAEQPAFREETHADGLAGQEQPPEETPCPCAWEQGERAAALAALFAPAAEEETSPQERCLLPADRWEERCLEDVLQRQPAWKPGRGRLMGVFVNAFAREYPRQNWQIFSQAGGTHVLRCLCAQNGSARYALPARDVCAPPPGLPAGSRLLTARNGRKYWVFSAREG